MIFASRVVFESLTHEMLSSCMYLPIAISILESIFACHCKSYLYIGYCISCSYIRILQIVYCILYIEYSILYVVYRILKSSSVVKDVCHIVCQNCLQDMLKVARLQSVAQPQTQGRQVARWQVFLFAAISKHDIDPWRQRKA